MPTNNLAHLLASRVRSIKSRNGFRFPSMEQRHEEEIDHLCKEFMPSGSGFDNGTMFDLDRSTPAKLVFATGFHHMNDAGMYDGWTQHLVTMTATFDGFDIKVSGRDRNGIKDYIAETFDQALRQTITAEWDAQEEEFTFTRVGG